MHRRDNIARRLLLRLIADKRLLLLQLSRKYPLHSINTVLHPFRLGAKLHLRNYACFGLDQLVLQ